MLVELPSGIVKYVFVSLSQCTNYCFQILHFVSCSLFRVLYSDNLVNITVSTLGKEVIRSPLGVDPHFSVITAKGLNPPPFDDVPHRIKTTNLYDPPLTRTHHSFPDSVIAWHTSPSKLKKQSETSAMFEFNGMKVR
jgi:hypothetical protein